MIEKTTEDSRNLDFSEVLDARPPQRAAFLFGAMGLLAAAAVLFDWNSAWTAVARLTNPLNSVEWPRKTHWMVCNPTDRVARGQAFEVKVVDAQGASLPRDAMIYYRSEGSDGNVVEQAERMTPVDHAMTARRESCMTSFSYRIVGGDDVAMPWTEVAVVDPPAVDSVDIRLTAPAYCGGRTVHSEEHIQALVGTRIQMTGKLTAPASSVVLCLEDGRKIPAQMGNEGRTFSLPMPGNDWIVDKSETYWFETTDPAGLHGIGDRWEIRAIPDLPPTVTIEQPTANLFVTPQATVRLRVSAKDDLALKTIGLVWHRSPSANDSLTLYAGPESPPFRSISDDSATTSQGDRHSLVQRWNLATLELKPGDHLTFEATASDYALQTATSESRQLNVISPQELEDRLLNRLRIILSELDRAVKMEQNARTQVDATGTHLREAQRITQGDGDRLQAVQLGQREVRQVLAGSGEGVPMHIHALLTELENNHIDHDDLPQRMRELQNTLDRLDRESLGPIAQELTSAAKTSQIAVEHVNTKSLGGDATQDAPPQIAASQVLEILGSVQKRQDNVIAALRRILEQLSQWDNYRRFHRELSQLLHDQEALDTRTTDVGRRTLSHDIKDLSSQDAMAVREIAQSQRDLVHRLDRTLGEMLETSESLQSLESEAAATLRNAADEARRGEASGQMLTAASQIEQNQIGRATASQKQVEAILTRVCDLLERSNAASQGHITETIKLLHQRQQAILNETQRLLTVAESPSGFGRVEMSALRDLVRQQKTLQADTLQLGREAEEAAVIQQTIADAAEPMGQAAALLDHRKPDANAVPAEQEALKQLTLLLNAFQPPAQAASAVSALPNEETQQGQSNNAAQNTSRREHLLVELHLLKLLQQDLGEQTQKLREAAANDTTKPPQQQYEQLSDEQSRLGERTEKLRTPTESEDDSLSLLTPISQRMREAGGRIRQATNLENAESLQRQILADLDWLMRELAKSNERSKSAKSTAAAPGTTQKPAKSGAAPSSSDRSPDNAQPSDSAAKKPDDSTSHAKSGEPSTATGRSRDGDAAQSKSDLNAMHGRMKQLWGELPAHAREQMLQLPLDELPPKYEESIEEYFRRLSQEKPKE
jgi:uncharacterized protein YjiS (DUF1127 family)